MKVLLFAFLMNVLLVRLCHCQEKFPTDIYIFTEKPNTFFMGEDSVVHFIKKKYQVCKNSSSDETVVVKFVVEPDGRNTNLHFITDNPALLKNKVSEMFTTFPKWQSGVQNGEKVRSIRFLYFKCSGEEVVLPPYKSPSF